MATEYFQLQAHFSCAGQFAMCVFHYRIIDPSESDEYLLARQLIEAIDDGGGTSWIMRLMQMQSEDSFLSSVVAKRVAPTGGNTAAQPFVPTDFPGAIGVEIGTQQIAACLIWIADGTPGESGRNFIPGVPEDALISSRWTEDFYDLADVFIAKHLTGFSVAGGIFLPVVYDRVAETGFVPDNGYLSPLVGTQRRREVPV